jgi:hypothetical protein
MINITDKEILQINSGIIAGALVFLTLSSISPAPTEEERVYRISSILFGVLILVMFSISSARALSEDCNQAKSAMRWGFRSLIGGGTAFVVTNLIALLNIRLW